MAGIIQGVTQSFLSELLSGVHDFTTDTIKIALYSSTASLGPLTTAYTTTGEVSASGYSAGGSTLTPTVSTASYNGQHVAYVDFADVSWSAAITARGAMIYNATEGNKSIWLLNFGIDRVSTTTFSIAFPTPGFDTAIIRLM